MSDFLGFLSLIGTELYELFVHYKNSKANEAQATLLAMRIARKVSDEIALREIRETPPDGS